MPKRFLHTVLFGPLCLVLLMWQLSVLAPCQSQVRPDMNSNLSRAQEASAAGVASDLSRKNVLILHTFTYDTSAYLVMDPIFLKGFTDAGLDASNLYFEFLDLLRHRDQAHRRETAEHLRRKFTDQPIDLIIALHRTALSYLLEDGKGLFPGVPVINVIADPDWLREDFRTANEYRLQELKRPSVIMPLAIGTEPTIKNILTLLPETRTLVVISGSDRLDRLTEQSVRRTLEAWHGRLQVEYLSGLPLEEVLERVSALAPKTAILYTVFGADTKGRAYRNYDVLRKISRGANAPIFGLYDTLLGDGGIVGGTMPTYSVEAARTVRLALEILRGRLPAEPVTILPAPTHPVFDWPELKRWGLNESALPADATILNKPVSAWEMYKLHIIGAVAFCVLETALIIFLIVQRSRKKVAEEELRKTEGKYRDIFEGAVEGIFETSLQGQPLTANPALARILGYDSPAELISAIHDSAHQLYADPDKRREFAGLLEKQDVVRGFECEFLRRDGKKIWVSLNGRRVCSPDGKTLYYSGFLEDITERKRVEQALHKSQEKAQRVAMEALAMAEIGRIISSTLTIEEVYEPFAAVVKRIIPFDRIVISTVDSEKGTFKNVYMAGTEIGDREVGEVHTLEGSGMAEMLRTKSPFLLQAEEFSDYQDRFPMLFSTFQAGFRSILNLPLISKGEIIGGLLLRSFESHAYTDQHVRLAERIGDQIAGAIANAQLFLKQKQAEEALRASEDRFRQVAETVSDFIWEVDANGLYRYTSPSVEGILGYKPDELIGKKHFYDLFAPEVREELKAAALKAFAAKQSFRVFPNPNLSKEGRVVQLETSGSPMLDAGGNLVGYRGADTDVTERKRSEKALAESQAQIAAVMNSTKDFVWSVDPERFGVLTWNRAFGDYFLERRGIELKVGMTPAELVPPEYVPFWHDVFSRALREEFVVVEYVVVAQTITLLLSLHAMQRDGRTFGISVFGKDITERKLAEKALGERLRFEELLSGISSRFVNIPPDRVDSEIEDGLRRILEFFQVDRCGLVHIPGGGTTFQNTHIAIADDVAPVPKGVKLPISLRPWAYEKLIRKNQVVSFSRIDDLPAEASIDRQGYIEWGIRSNLNIPIITGEAVENIITVQSVKSERAWPEEYVPRLRLLGEIFVNALERKQTRLDIEERLRFESLMSDLSAGFVNLPPDEVDSEINKGLRSITEFFDTDRCSIGLFSEDRTQPALAFEYRRVEAEPAPGSLSKEQMPWYIKQLIEGKPVVINRVADFPPEAEDERQLCLAKGMKSLLSLPLVSGGKTLGSCALVLTRAERIWLEELVKRFQLLTEVFANALQGKRADTLLRTSEEKFRQFFAHVPEFCYIVSQDGTILDVNDWALHGLGYEKEDLVDKPLATIYAPDSISKMEDLFARWKERGEVRNEEMVVLTKKGEKRTVLLNVGAVRDKDGAIIHSTSIQTDITESKQAEAEVNRARKQLLHVERSAHLGELTASLAHELNQPLAAILSNAQAALRFLQSDKVNVDEFREILHDIIQDDQRAGNVIRSLRSMMKREERERNPIILNTVLNDVIQIFHTESIFRNVHIDTEVDESLPPVLGDRVQLQQVVLNLIVNAADAMSQNPPEQRKIILRTQVKNDRIRVTIRDFGPGVDQGNVDRIFQPFFTTKGTGLGMGLAVSQTIVEAHGGHIWAENNPDAGATFFIELPIYESRK